MAGDGYVAATGKRLGEDRFFSGAFVVFRCISEILCAFCLVVLRFFVYLQTTKGVATICPPEYINVNKLNTIKNNNCIVVYYIID